MCNFEANKFFLMETQDTLIGGFAKCPDNTPGMDFVIYCTLYYSVSIYNTTCKQL